MARGRGTLTVRIIGDSRDLDKTFSRVQRKVGGFGSSLVGVAKRAAVFGGAVAGAAAFAGQQILSLGGQLEQMDAKANTVFGNQVGAVRKWAKANARDMGLTKTELTGLAASFGDLLVPMGFTRKRAADMSRDVVGLSGALAEWSGGQRSAAEVAQILSKAMLGERESLKELGISITEADVQQRLLEKGQQDLTGAALAQAKAVATQELIFAKSKDAQAAYDKGTAKSLRTQARLNATFKEIRDTVVRAVLPIATQLATWIGDRLPGAFAKAQLLAERWGPTIRNVFTVVAKVLGFVIKVVAGVVTAFFNAGKGIGHAINAIRGVVRGAVAWIVDKFLWLAEKIVGAAATAFGWIPGIGPKLQRARDAIGQFRRDVVADLRGIGNAAVSNAAHLQTFIDAGNAAALSPGARAALRRGASGSPKQGPGFAHGGIVPGPTGHAMPIVAHGGEVVLNRAQQRALLRGGGGGVTVVFQAGAVVVQGSDPRAARDIVDQVSRDLAREIVRLRRGA